MAKPDMAGINDSLKAIAALATAIQQAAESIRAANLTLHDAMNDAASVATLRKLGR